MKTIFEEAGADPDILKRGGALCWSPWLAEEKKTRFQMVWKGQNSGRNYKLLAKYFYEHFQIFSVLIYNESLSMKSYHFLKICKRFDNEKVKTLMQLSMRKEKLRKNGLWFITGCFIKSFDVIINHFFVLQAHSQPNFWFFISEWRRKYQKGKEETANS